MQDAASVNTFPPDPAMPAAERDANMPRARLRTTLFVAVDYAVNVVILFGFATIGTISYDVPIQVAAVAAIFNAIFISGIVSGFTRRFRDPSVTALQVFAACGINLLALLLAPQIAYMAVVNLFVLLSYGSLRFSLRAFFLAWLALSLVLGIELRAVGGHVNIAVTSGVEQWFFWFVVTVALGRFLAVNAEVSRLRVGLHQRNKDLALMAARLADLASRDDLTGLWNRREFMRLLLEERKRVERRSGRFCVALIDADHFKQVNDRFGHQIGDAVLQELAQIFDHTRRMTDTLARYGGEEFILLLFDADLDAALHALERTRSGVERNDWERIAAGLRMTVSIGVATWEGGEDVEQTIYRADAALYDAKAAGRNCVKAAPAALQA